MSVQAEPQRAGKTGRARVEKDKHQYLLPVPIHNGDVSSVHDKKF